MSAFFRHVALKHPEEFVVMVLDGASSYRSEKIVVPENIALDRLPTYSPELNPAGRLWDDVREKEFANRVFDSFEAAIDKSRPLIESPGEFTGVDSIINGLGVDI